MSNSFVPSHLWHSVSSYNFFPQQLDSLQSDSSSEESCSEDLEEEGDAMLSNPLPPSFTSSQGIVLEFGVKKHHHHDTISSEPHASKTSTYHKKTEVNSNSNQPSQVSALEKSVSQKATRSLSAAVRKKLSSGGDNLSSAQEIQGVLEAVQAENAMVGEGSTSLSREGTVCETKEAQEAVAGGGAGGVKQHVTCDEQHVTCNEQHVTCDEQHVICDKQNASAVCDDIQATSVPVQRGSMFSGTEHGKKELVEFSSKQVTTDLIDSDQWKNQSSSQPPMKIVSQTHNPGPECETRKTLQQPTCGDKTSLHLRDAGKTGKTANKPMFPVKPVLLNYDISKPKYPTKPVLAMLKSQSGLASNLDQVAPEGMASHSLTERTLKVITERVRNMNSR